MRWINLDFPFRFCIIFNHHRHYQLIIVNMQTVTFQARAPVARTVKCQANAQQKPMVRLFPSLCQGTSPMPDLEAIRG
jgi:hypothetical protein